MSEEIGPRGLTDAFRARYRLERELGKGGMGAVYQALDLRLERPVAIKFLQSEDAESRARFAREARTLARVQHPNVTLVFEVADDAGAPFLVSELVVGESLSELLGRAGRLPEADALRYALGIAHGLACVHEMGIVHRDLKSANVLVARDGTPKICDFGLARSEKEGAVTQSGAITGTPEYIAPEVLQAAEIGPPCDMYALGCMLHEMLSGTVPFPVRASDGATRPMLAVLNAHVLEPPPRLPPELRVTPELADLVRSLLAKKPGERPTAPRAIALLEALPLASGPRSLVRSTSKRAVSAAMPAPTQQMEAPAAEAPREKPLRPRSRPSRPSRPVSVPVASGAAATTAGSRGALAVVALLVLALAGGAWVATRPRRGGATAPAAPDSAVSAGSSASPPASAAPDRGADPDAEPSVSESAGDDPGPDLSASPSPAPVEALPPIDARDPEKAVPELMARLSRGPWKLADADAAIARAVPDAALGVVIAAVAAVAGDGKYPLEAPARDLAAVALALAHGGTARQTAWNAVGRLLGGPPRTDEPSWLRLVAGHDPGAVEALETCVAAFRSGKFGPKLMPPARVAAMQARVAFLAGRADRAKQILDGALAKSPHSAMLAAAAKALFDTEPRPGTDPEYAWDIGGAPVVWVRGGPFVMGHRISKKGKRESADPPHVVRMSGYFIDRYETTVGAYREFHDWIAATDDHRWCDASSVCRTSGGAHPMGADVVQFAKLADAKEFGLSESKTALDPEVQFRGEARLPVTCVNWFDADAFARWSGRTLPTEAQWEKAARGVNGKRKWPWGDDEPTKGLQANFGHQKQRKLDPVGSHPSGVSPFGADDMAGNVAEWCADWYAEREYDQHKGRGSRDPGGPVAGVQRVVRGGSVASATHHTYTYERDHESPTELQDVTLGFRCAHRPR